MATGYALFACYCAVQSLLAAIRLQEPRYQPTVESLDRLIRNLDTLADIALVNLPTREVLRRHRAALHLASTTEAATASSKVDDATKLRETLKSYQSSRHKMSLLDDSKSEMKNTKGDLPIDARTSKEVREKLEEEAFKASIPTKEMEIIEWEQALFRAAKRALARSKVQTPKIAKLVKTLVRSSKLNPGLCSVLFSSFCGHALQTCRDAKVALQNCIFSSFFFDTVVVKTDGEVVLTRWEAEFYSHVAAQAHKKLNAAYAPIEQDPTRPRRHSSSFNAGGLSDEDESGTDDMSMDGSGNGNGDTVTESKNGGEDEDEGSHYSISSFGENSEPSWLGEGMSEGVSPSPGQQLVHGALVSAHSGAASPFDNNDSGFGDLDLSSESEADGQEYYQSQDPSQSQSQSQSQDTSRVQSRRQSAQSRNASRVASAESGIGSTGFGSPRSRAGTAKSRVQSAQSAQSAQSGYSAQSPYERLGTADLDAESVVYSLEDDEPSNTADAETAGFTYGVLSNDSHDSHGGPRQHFDSIALSDHPDHFERAEHNSPIVDRQRLESIALSAMASDDESVNVSPPTSEDER